MTSINSRLQEVYAGLCRVLRDPHDYGLGETVPQALENILDKALSTLGQIMQENEQTLPNPNGDLEAELSQDADRPCHPGNR